MLLLFIEGQILLKMFLCYSRLVEVISRYSSIEEYRRVTAVAGEEFASELLVARQVDVGLCKVQCLSRSLQFRIIDCTAQQLRIDGAQTTLGTRLIRGVAWRIQHLDELSVTF